MSSYELRDDFDVKVSKSEENKELPDVVIVNRLTSTIDTNGRPLDKYHLVFLILLLHGIGTLMPWNMFINAETYFRDYKLAPQNATDIDVSQDQLDNMRKSFLSYLGLAAQIPNVLFNGLNLVANVGSGNLNLRVNISLILEAIVFLLTIILAVVDSTRWPGAFFYITMISVVVLNMASGVYQNCVFGIGAKFPGSYTNAILIGSNTSGTFTSVVNLLAIWLAPQPQEAAMYYFITALLIISFCIFTYNILPMNSFFRYHDTKSNRAEQQLEICAEASTAKTSINNSDDNNKNDIPETLRKTVDAMVPRPNTRQDLPEDPSFMGQLDKKWQVFKKCWPQCLNVFLTFFLTLALFPAVLADVKQVHNLFDSKYFSSFACFLIFNLFAMIGNLISSWTLWPGKDRVWLLVVARFLFIPFFLFCNFNPKTRHWPVLIQSDIVFIIGNVLMALSSGYLSSLCMMFASSGLEPDEAPKAGMLAAFFLVLGIFVGINSSFLLTWIVEL